MIDQPTNQLSRGALWMSTLATSSMIPTDMASSAAPGLGRVLSMCELSRIARDLPCSVPSEIRKIILVRFWYDLYSRSSIISNLRFESGE
jgi:hypothetical protein